MKKQESECESEESVSDSYESSSEAEDLEDYKKDGYHATVLGE